MGDIKLTNSRTDDRTPIGQSGRIQVLHVISGLNTGGTEMFLARLAPRLKDYGVDSTVVSLTDDGKLANTLRSNSVPVISIGIKPPRPPVLGMVRLWRLIKSEGPDLVMTWLPHADVLGGLVATAARIPVVWNLRSAMATDDDSLTHRLLITAQSALSYVLPERIVCVSNAARVAHQLIGFDRNLMEVIHNGIDTELFQPNIAVRDNVRENLMIAEDAVVIGHVARLDPVKDHLTSLRAFARFRGSHPNSVLILCGSGTDELPDDLGSEVQISGLGDSIRLLGERRDIAALTSAFDLAICSSRFEGLSNAVGEAMACNVPVASTETGDARDLIGDTGIVVPVGDPKALGDALVRLLTGNRPAPRDRILELYSMNSCVESYSVLFTSIANRGRKSKIRSKRGQGGVAIVLPTLDVGGSERVAIQLANSLADAGEDVTVLLTGHSGPLEGRLLQSVHLRRLDSGRARKSVWSIRAELKRGAYRSVATFHVQMTIATAMASIGTGCRFVASEHSLVRRRTKQLPRWRRPIHRAMLRWSYHRAVAVVVPSEQAAEEVRALAGGSVAPVVLPSPLIDERHPLGVEVDHSWLKDRQGPRIIFVGRVVSEKNLELSHSIVHALRSRGADARLLIVGPDITGDAARMAKQSPTWVSDVGAVEDPLPWIEAADVLLMTSRFESFGNVLLESVAAGTPVVVVGTEGAPHELLMRIGGGLYVQGNSPEDGADAVQAVLTGLYPPVRSTALKPYSLGTATQAFLQVMEG